MKIRKTMRAVVTGGGSGIGREIALNLARRKLRVLVSDRDAATAAQVAANVTAAGGEGVSFPCDVTDQVQVAALAAEAVRLWGGVDLVVLNAGIGTGGAIDATPVAAFRRVMEVNFFGVLHGLQAFAPVFKQARRGHFLIVASLAGLVPMPEFAAYVSSKHAVVGLGQSALLDLKPHGVGLTLLCPSFVRTAIFDNADKDSVESDRLDLYRGLMEAQKLSAADVADAGIDAVERNRVFSLPMSEGRLLWRMHRLLPQRYVPSLFRSIERTMAKEARRARRR